jgi:hypothetical protein
MHIEPDKYYDTEAPELRLIASRQTLAKWRHEKKGPPYYRFGHRVRYLGSDVLNWMQEQRIKTDGN